MREWITSHNLSGRWKKMLCRMEKELQEVRTRRGGNQKGGKQITDAKDITC